MFLSLNVGRWALSARHGGARQGRKRVGRLHFLREQTETHLEQASRANLSCCAIGDFRPALSANPVGGLHLMSWASALPPN
jgi:hypothetical protein